ncbi:hypothetical protein PybrP1_000532 [[Pythium] brassicae (nom. inval.)]|nr:hypothetical protein PybrP1_000532 [[Pythium] brassicae (nom. inval.)]
MAANVPLKLVFKDSIVRVSANPATLDVAAVRALVSESFGTASVALKYTDPEGDLVTVALDEDVRTALALFAKPDGSFGTVRFTAVPTARAAFQENVVDPVVRAMEHLVETLDAAKASVKSDEWVQRAAQSNAHFRNEVLRGAVADARDSLLAVRERIREVPFDRMVADASSGIKSAAESAAAKAKGAVEDARKEKIVQDATEGIKSAAEGLSKFAQDAVADAKKDPTVQDVAEGLKTVAEGISEAAKDAVGELKSKVAPYFAQPGAAVAPAPVESTSDSEWEQVAEQEHEPAQQIAVAEAPAAPAAVVVVEEEALVVSAEEKKWSEHLATIREIVPGVETARAVEQLEAADGDLAVALNALMEEM